jgi:Ca-activated chloride channel homolog
MRFASPLFLLLLLLPAGHAWVRWRARHRVPSERIAFPVLAALAGAPRTARSRWRWLPTALRVASLALAVGALARPQRAGELREVRTRSRNVVVALDISSSMKAQDFRPGNRLEVARRTVADLVGRRDGDLLGLVVFAGRAFLQAPLNPDTALVRELVEQVEIGMLPDGTAIGTALALSLAQLRDLPAKGSAIVLITDGANNAGQPTPLAAAEAARALGIRIHAIGLTSDVPIDADSVVLWRKGRQPDRLTTADEAILKRITQRTGGRYFRAANPDALERVLGEIDRLERIDARIDQLRHYTELYPVLLWPAVLLLAADWVLRATWLRSPLW